MGDEVVSATNRAPHIRAGALRDGDALVYVVVEANLKDPRAYEGTLLDDLLRAVTRSAPYDPAAIAGRISATLRDDARYRPIGAVFYAGVRIGAEAIDVCTAGDLRVHLIDAEGRLLHVTRDHNVASDGTPDQLSNFARMPPGFLENVPTRTLPPFEKPAETWQWPRRRAATVLICSSRVHQYRDPATYANDVNVPDLGFAATIAIAAPAPRTPATG